jgi:hypothetical protein
VCKMCTLGFSGVLWEYLSQPWALFRVQNGAQGQKRHPKSTPTPRFFIFWGENRLFAMSRIVGGAKAKTWFFDLVSQKRAKK